MPGTSTRLVAIVAVVVGMAVGAVFVLIPAARTATLIGSRPAGPEVPRTAAAGHARWVAGENAKPGTTDWQITGPVDHGNIEGYADTTSAVSGDTVRLFVSTDAATYRVDAYRMGWYGGTQGRLVWRSPPQTGFRQGPPSVDPLTNTVEAHWAPTLSITLDKAWPPGDYLLKLVGDNGYAQFVPLAVRDDTSKAALVVVNAVTTWQAYNKWGGHSLYEGVDRLGATTPEARSQIASFDRPYANDSGAGDFLGNELPLVSLVEKSGYDVTYETDIDVHRRGALLTNHRAVLSLGHDEYWSAEMRAAVERARDAGVNVAFFGANALYRAIRLAPSDLGDLRHEINYRIARDDPMTGVDNSRVTVGWREPPVNRPESSLVGDYYQCNPVKADMVVADPSAWVFAGTGLAAGDKLKDLVGPEYDRYDPSAPQPPGPVQVLTHSPLHCGGQASYSDMTWYTTASGAGVFATGSNWWISRLNLTCVPSDSCLEQHALRITLNVLDAFSLGPAGRSHPSVSNVSSLGEVRGTTPLDAGERVVTTTTTPYTAPTTVGSRPSTSLARTTTTTTRPLHPPTSVPTLPSLPFPLTRPR
ncbi:MAG: N,N-dimethylformamidase beta subunit family domain-containing protein [Acidimicrobiales bacterium]